MFGWYSLNAYNNGDTEYIFMNEYQQQTFCTFITETKKIPQEYYNKYTDTVFCGTVLTSIDII